MQVRDAWRKLRESTFAASKWVEERLASAPAWGVALAAALAVALISAMAELQGILRGMHRPGGRSVDIGDLASGGEGATEAVGTWLAYDRAAVDEFANPDQIAKWFVYLDALFAFTFAFVVAYGLARLGRRLRELAKNERTLARGAAMRRQAGLTFEDEAPATTRGAVQTVLDVYRWLVVLSLFVLLPLYLLSDWAEGVFTYRVVDDLWGALQQGAAGDTESMAAGPLRVVALLKWALVALIALAGLAAGLAAIYFGRERVRPGLRAAVVVRAQLLIVVFMVVALLLDPTEQAADAIRRWRDDPVDGVAAVGFTLMLSLTGFATAWNLLGQPKPGKERLGQKAGIVTGVCLAAALSLAVAGFLLGRHDAGVGLYAIALILFVVAALSIPVRKLPIEPVLPVADARRSLAPLVGALPLVVLGIIVMRAAIPERVYAGDHRYTSIILTGVGLQVLGWAALLVMRWFAGRGGRRRAVTAGLLFVAALSTVFVSVGAWRDPWTLGDRVGGIGVFAAALVAASLVAWGLGLLSEGVEPPKAFLAIRLQRIPVLTILAAWALLAAGFDHSGRYYDVRLDTARGDFTRDVSLETAFHDWRRRAVARNGERQAVPLVFVAASGGGIRAAYWPAAVLDCLVEGAEPCQGGSKERAEAIFLASGVSGGSLGLVTYAAHRVAGDGDGWVERSLGGDTFAPTLARALFVDIPMALIRRDGGMDRAETLERAWERSWGDEANSPLQTGLFELADRGDMPYLVLNGTKVQDGCRFNTSGLDLAVEPQRTEKTAAAPTSGENRSEFDKRLVEDCLALRPWEASTAAHYGDRKLRDDWTLAATEDLGDYLCEDEDVRLSTAALLSARFPLISPSGRIAKCSERESDVPGINIVDGGYFDTSAASTIAETWSALASDVANANENGAPCIVPMFLQLDNGYADVVGGTPSRPKETEVPLRTLATGRDTREAQARQAGALLFSKPFGRVDHVTVADPDLPGGRRTIERYAHIYPRAHPGAQAPLGWTLSRTSRDDLAEQLFIPENLDEQARVNDWFDPTLRCEPA